MATIRKRGEYQWEAQIRKKGYPAQSKTFITKAEAEAWAAVIESEMVRGVFVSRGESESTTFAAALERYAHEIADSKKGAREDLYWIRALQRLSLSRRYLASIQSTDIARYRDQRLEEGWAPATVVRELALISHLFNVCRKEWGMHALQNPVELIRRPTIKNDRERRILTALVYQKRDGILLEEELTELEMLAKHTDSVELPFFLTVAVETAMRRGEILGLARRDVDVKKRVARLADTKNGSARDVPLSSKAIEAFNGLPRQMDGRIFTLTPDAVSRAFSRAVIRARKEYEIGQKTSLMTKGLAEGQAIDKIKSDPFLQDLRLHDLRHEATSRLAEIFPIHELTKITGHKDTRMLMRYYHPKAEELAKKLA
ncbi:site-specific integrase [Chromobacterium amazonense]|uniref:tyrosine-type recombinase/integrase n=3 Tax=Chromobacterium amazonense TaxID=1382803 RepID=UPI00237DF65D|nr:site-specific integrase [Chromobacterium amazonense]MDE1715877.1 site-specific integrase [Chromobacterium amazonense]